GQSRTNRIQAKNAVIASQIDNRAITLDLKKKAEFAWHGYETARLAAERFIQKQSEMANRLLQLTREGYQLGELDLLTVLDTQRTYLAVQSGYYRALKDYYLSAINMEELVGRELIFQSKND
ncbi:MAG: TolC family protein, partial [Bacteroidetes Order II. Incertae sedis bacterium]|nr:TolC family protein [Bacteroidetes Order II. bacterium]